jgi:hypothetical protein
LANLILGWSDFWHVFFAVESLNFIKIGEACFLDVCPKTIDRDEIVSIVLSKHVAHTVDSLLIEVERVRTKMM